MVKWPLSTGSARPGAHSRTPPPRLEQGRGPFGLFQTQARDDRILAVLDLSSIGAKVIRLVEDRLEVERHIGLARQEGDADLRQPLGYMVALNTNTQTPVQRRLRDRVKRKDEKQIST